MLILYKTYGQHTVHAPYMHSPRVPPKSILWAEQTFACVVSFKSNKPAKHHLITMSKVCGVGRHKRAYFIEGMHTLYCPIVNRYVHTTALPIILFTLNTSFF